MAEFGKMHRGMVVEESPNPGSAISVGNNRSLETPGKGYMTLEEGNPGPTGPPIITGNPNSSEIGDWLQQNWQPLLIGIGIAAFLFWMFSSKN